MPDLWVELQRRTWRWFIVRVRGLSGDSAFAHHLRRRGASSSGPTGERGSVLDDVGAVEAFMAGPGSG